MGWYPCKYLWICGFLLMTEGFFLYGCQTVAKKKVESPKQFSLWKKPKPTLLYRKLLSGDSPEKTEATICKWWSLGNCQKLTPVSQALFSKGPTVYSYKHVQDAPTCNYTFLYRRWGLTSVAMNCRVEHSEQLDAILRRYRRWYGKGISKKSGFGQRVYIWRNESEGRQVWLRVKGLKLFAKHEDIRSSWMRHLKGLIPEKKADKSASKMSQSWGAVPLLLRKEVLDNFGRFLWHWEEQMSLEGKPIRLPEGEVRLRLSKSCKPVVVQKSGWFGPPWFDLGFKPLDKIRLGYAFRTGHVPFLPKTLKHQFLLKSRVLQSKKKVRALRRLRRKYWPFRIEARGCGRVFLLQGYLVILYKRSYLMHPRISVFEQKAWEEKEEKGTIRGFGRGMKKLLPIPLH